MKKKIKNTGYIMLIIVMLIALYLIHWALPIITIIGMIASLVDDS